MSRERARRREEREREAAVRAAARAAAEEREERRAARRRRVASVLPQPRPQARQATGVLARRRRNQALGTLALVVLVNAASFAFLEHWAARLLVLIVSALAAPVLHTLLFRRR
ncbi:hypothetical protein [Nocardioides lijunqiniae]|uniref:hypothetical protein n=1 Tax=Nocardioides lijunqiniae TaxID=2760832 RepID=UPI0018789729|nr:hypothetical protein [Nocardioides lijunqiniae]